MRDSMPKFLKKFANFFNGVCGCEYLTQSKPSVVALVKQILCGIQKQINYIFVVVLCSFFLWFCCLEGVLIKGYHVESWRPLSWNRTNSDSFSSRKQKKSSQNTNAASTVQWRGTFLRHEFMRNSTYSVIEVQAVSLLPRREVHLRISFLASRLFKMSKITTSSLVDNTFTIFALKCLLEVFRLQSCLLEIYALSFSFGTAC